MELLRDRLEVMETLREHLCSILLDWPVCMMSEVDKRAMADVVRLQAGFSKALCGNSDPFQLDAVEDIESAAKDRVLDYYNLFSTERYFHPEVVVAEALFGLHVKVKKIEREAPLLSGAIDPYVSL